MERIYTKLNRLIVKLQQIGYNPDTGIVLHNVGEEEKLRSISHHGEKLAFAFSLTKKPNGVSSIRIMKNIRICDDCHVFLKLASIAVARPIIIRDSSKFHHFFGGKCSCKDHWWSLNQIVLSSALWMFSKEGFTISSALCILSNWNKMKSYDMDWDFKDLRNCAKCEC